MSSDTSMNLSTQFVMHVSVRESSFAPGLSTHLSQQKSLNSWIWENWIKIFFIYTWQKANGRYINGMIIHIIFTTWSEFQILYLTARYINIINVFNFFLRTYSLIINDLGLHNIYLSVELSLLLFSHEKILKFWVCTFRAWIIWHVSHILMPEKYS